MMIPAKYTEVLKNLMDNEKTNALIENALSSYPLYEKQSKEEFIPSIVPTREELNKKILNAYKYREIGFETVGRFLEELQITMEEIMPYYNQLFFSADQDFNIIYNVDYKRTTETKRAGESESEVNGEDSSETTNSDKGKTTANASDNSNINSTIENTTKNVNSQTPQNEISIAAENIDSVPYADSVSWNKTNNKEESNTSGSSTSTTETESAATNKTATSNSLSSSGKNNESEDTIETTKGNFGVVSAQDLVLKFRDTIINIEQMIINDSRLSELFMTVF